MAEPLVTDSDSETARAWAALIESASLTGDHAVEFNRWIRERPDRRRLVMRHLGLDVLTLPSAAHPFDAQGRAASGWRGALRRLWFWVRGRSAGADGV